jgi:hypothetical protein
VQLQHIQGNYISATITKYFLCTRHHQSPPQWHYNFITIAITVFHIWLNNYFILWLLGSSFNDTFSVTRLYSIYDRMISEWWWIGKDLVGSGHGLIFQVLSRICLEGLRKITKTLNQDRQLPGWESNPGTPKYKEGVLTIRPWCSVSFYELRKNKFIICGFNIIHMQCIQLLFTLP